MAEHSTLTGASLHEPKGAATASSGQVYVADGAGSGSFSTKKGYYVISAYAADISAAEDAYIPIPKAGTVVRASTVVGGAVTGGDLGITITNSSAQTMGTITVASSGSAAGTTDSVAISTNNTVTEDDYVKISGDGGPTAHTYIAISILVEYDI